MRLPYVGGGPGDVSINTWHFRAPDITDAGLGPITAALSTFYTAVKSRFSTDVSFGSGNVTYYDLAQPKPRAPIFEGLLGTTGTGGGTPGPSEIAICLSFYGLKTAGYPFGRSRGRIYLGPLNAGLMAGNNVAAADVTAIVNAANTLLGTSNAAAWKWVVYSQTQAESPIGLHFPDDTVIGGWVDNAWDVQRRRGAEPSARTTFGLNPTGS